MAEEKKDEAFLSRWSRLKKEQESAPEKKVETPAPVLPPLDKLTPESDFTGFMHPKVEDAVRRVALKKLFSDPHFNIPDPYEAYSGDWTVGEPIPQAMLDSLEQMKTMLKKSPEEMLQQAEAAEQEKAAGQAEKKPDEPGKQDA